MRPGRHAAGARPRQGMTARRAFWARAVAGAVGMVISCAIVLSVSRGCDRAGASTMTELTQLRGAGSCAAYAVERDAPGVGIQYASAWAGPGPALVAKTPSATDSLDTLDSTWVSVSTASRSWAAFRFACVSVQGDTGSWSNWTILAPAGGAWPDTSAMAWQGVSPLGWRRVGPGQAAWKGFPFDHPRAAERTTVESQSAIQTRLAPAICRVYGYWVIAGQRTACP